MQVQYEESLQLIVFVFACLQMIFCSFTPLRTQHTETTDICYFVVCLLHNIQKTLRLLGQLNIILKKHFGRQENIIMFLFHSVIRLYQFIRLCFVLNEMSSPSCECAGVFLVQLLWCNTSRTLDRDKASLRCEYVDVFGNLDKKQSSSHTVYSDMASLLCENFDDIGNFEDF